MWWKISIAATIAVIIVAVVAVLNPSLIKDFFALDSCLDSGGAWVADTHSCRH